MPRYYLTEKDIGDFAKQVLGENSIDHAIDWICSNINPECVYSDKALKEWAEENLGYIATPEDVFTVKTLEEWARDNDWVKKDEVRFL